MMAPDVPAVFRNIVQKPGLQIWTINKMQLTAVPSKAFGNFFEGDCYIILNISQNKYSVQRTDIHYWIGKSSSPDEQGAAAIYVTQLDEYLGGSPVQHREVQNWESAQFKSYFKNGLIYKKGGVASGFNHVDTNAYDVLRLLHVKGSKHVTAAEVDVSWNSFNNGDIFILDVGKVIVQWNGPKSNRKEKLKAVLLAQDIRDRERGGRAQIGVVEGGNERDSPELMNIMTTVLGQKPNQLKEAISDQKHDQMQNNTVRLYHVYENGGNLVVQEEATQPLTQDLLRSSDCYIVDHKGSSVMVWKGKRASKEERREALNRALGFIKAKNYPPSTQVEVMAEGGESAMFKQLFKTWKEEGQTQGLGKTHTVGKIAKVNQTKFDVKELHAHPELAAQHHMVDDGSGDVKVWRVENLELVEVNPKTYGQFYGGDCYLVLYSYERSRQQQYVLYMWLGRHATQDEITACAYQAVNIDNKYNGAPIQVRVVMGKEPRHFLAIFKGKLIIFEGGTGRPGGVVTDSNFRLFQVRGTTEYNTRAVEVPTRASSLNSNDVFVLKTPQSCYLWYGKGCSGDERVMGRAVSDVLSKQDKQVVTEGQEPVDFWLALGGKAPYASDSRLYREEPLHSPRLFECSNQTGQFRMTEVYDFDQCDLDEDDVMLLDTWEEIFLWVGKSSNKFEIQEAWTSAQDYLRTHPAGRDLDTPIIFIKQGNEPLTFTGWFSAWDPHKWSGGNSYEETRKKLNDAANVSQVTLDLSNTDLNRSPSGTFGGDYRAPGGPMTSPPVYKTHGGYQSPTLTTPTSPLFQKTPPPHTVGTGPSLDPKLLVNIPVDELPQDVDPSRREDYLSEVDFRYLLGTSRQEFREMPKWRQTELKKKAGLF